MTHNVAAVLERQDNSVFLRRRDAREDRSLLDDMRECGIGHLFKFITQNDSFAVEAYPRADMLRHQFVIAGKNLDFNSVTSQSEQRRFRALQRSEEHTSELQSPYEISP